MKSEPLYDISIPGRIVEYNTVHADVGEKTGRPYMIDSALLARAQASIGKTSSMLELINACKALDPFGVHELPSKPLDPVKDLRNNVMEFYRARHGFHRYTPAELIELEAIIAKALP